jgi:2-polyprenyl-6-methoxyphenol hydroxylase-like FAD-dependent oxidoreductase
LAITEAYVLAGELSRAKGNHQEAFRRYERRLRPFIARKQKSARNFAVAFAPKTWLGLWLRNLVTRLMSIPFVAPYFLGRDMLDEFDLPEYEIPGP